MLAVLIFLLGQEDRTSDSGDKADIRESTLTAHTCFLIKSLSQREEHIRDISVTLLTRLRDRFPQVKVLFLFIFLAVRLIFKSSGRYIWCLFQFSTLLYQLSFSVILANADA